MNNAVKFAPEIMRQRLLVEGYFQTEVDEAEIRRYFTTITGKLALRVYGEPIIFSPGGDGKAENQGYDAFIPLIDSGICLYVWTQRKFVSTILYTCKSFDEDAALQEIRSFFRLKDGFYHQSF